jgi:hypothetical protein
MSAVSRHLLSAVMLEPCVGRREVGMSAAPDIVAKWQALASEAAQAFEARWTFALLKRVEPDLAQRLLHQREVFREACISGTNSDVARHGTGVTRGYAVAIKAMEDAGEGDDAYQVGYDERSGLGVAVGRGKAPALRVKKLYPAAIYLTVDEVAILLGRVASLKPIVATKRQWPGCEILGDPIIGEQPINQFDQPIPADEATEQNA